MTAYRLKVYPNRCSREAYRVFNISGDYSLSDLAQEILNQFNFWDDDHLYEFSLSGRLYAPYNIICDEQDPESEDQRFASEVDLDDLQLCKGQKFYFHFDYGDEWLFVINVQKIADDLSDLPPAVQKGKIDQYPGYEDEDEDYEDLDEDYNEE